MEPNAHVQKRTGSYSSGCRVPVPPYPAPTALCIQTVGLTAASPPRYLPNRPASTLSSSLMLWSQVYAAHLDMFCLTSRLRTVCTHLAGTYRDHSILSQLRSRIGKTALASLLSQALDKRKIPIQSNTICFFFRKTPPPGISYHIFYYSDTQTSLPLLLTETSSQHTPFRCLHLEATSLLLPVQMVCRVGESLLPRKQ